jgi:hypothetical protein
MVPRHVHRDKTHDENHQALPGLGRRARVRELDRDIFEPKPRLMKVRGFFIAQMENQT